MIKKMKTSYSWFKILRYGLSFFFLNFFTGTLMAGWLNFPSIAGLKTGYESAALYFAVISLGWGSIFILLSFYKSFSKKLIPIILSILILEIFQILMFIGSQRSG